MRRRTILGTKKPAEDPRLKYLESLQWSDEESDDLKYGTHRNKTIDEKGTVEGKLINRSISLFNGSIVPVQPSLGTFYGNKTRKDVLKDTVVDYKIPYSKNSANIPNVSAKCKIKIGIRLLDYIWVKFQEFGADEAEMIQKRHVETIFDPKQIRMVLTLKKDIPLSKLTVLDGLESDDYIEYVSLMEDLADVFDVREAFAAKDDSMSILSSHLLAETCYRINPNGRYIPCCSHPSCSYYLQPDPLQKYLTADAEGIDKDKFTSSDLLRIEVAYHRHLNISNGKLRLRALPKAMQELGFALDKAKLPREFWDLQRDALIYGLEDFTAWVDKLRPKAANKTDVLERRLKYSLPDWLREEFQMSEILLYEHHFSMIDVDGGGTVDAQELQQLLSSFGTAISVEESQRMLDDFDADGTGTMDFTEFMVLIYKIQRNTVDLGSNDLALAMSEAKAQLGIFEEIEDVARHPPEGCQVVHFGGAVIVCDLLVEGPPGSLYAGGSFHVQVTFRDGYPHIAPDVQILTRVWSLLVLTQLDGRGRLLPLLGQGLWQSDWNIRRLLLHVREVLVGEEEQVGVNQLPENLQKIALKWVDGKGEWEGEGLPSLEWLCRGEEVAKMVKKLSRVEQLHLRVVYLFLFDKEQYAALARDYTRRFKYTVEEEEQQQKEKEEGEKEWKSGDDG